MRVITEERLKEWLKHVDDLCLDDTFWIEDDIKQYLEEIDTLTVDKLRPMSDVRGNNGYVMIFPITHSIQPGDCIEACLIGGGLMQTRDGINYGFAELHGWTYKPSYKQEKK